MNYFCSHFIRAWVCHYFIKTTECSVDSDLKHVSSLSTHDCQALKTYLIPLLLIVCALQTPLPVTSKAEPL